MSFLIEKLLLKPIFFFVWIVASPAFHHDFYKEYSSTASAYRYTNKPVNLVLLANPSAPKPGNPVKTVPVNTIRKKKMKKTKKKMGIYIALSAFFISTFIGAAFLIIKWRRKKQKDSQKTEDLELQQLNLSVRTVSDKKVSFEGSQDTPHKTMVESYTIEQLKKATEDFNSANLVEGSVFHGRLNGKNLAIKRTSLNIISKIDIGLFHDGMHLHQNIMRLYGTCVNQGLESYLVFEYAKNGSLKDWLHGGLAMKSHFIASCNCFLTWNQRLRICLDIAKALQFMHQIVNPGYIHRNIKTRNIFLDEEFHAKIGNFGMARCIEETETDQDSHPPEYIRTGVISPSIDVYAYGVVLLEVLSGRTAVKQDHEKIEVLLQTGEENELREYMDNALGENYSFDAAFALANLARACVKDDPSVRPNAGEMVEKLTRLVEDLPEGEECIISESSCKPLVEADASINTM